MSSSATIVHDPSEAVSLCPSLGLYLKPITKMSIVVSLPPLKPPGKSISNWEVMERLRGLGLRAHAPFSALRIAKSTLELIRFEGELEHRALVRPALAGLDGKTIKLAGFPDPLRVRAAELRPLDFPTRHDWDAYFRDARDMDETRPGERPDTIHLEGLPCRWFAARDPPTGSGGVTGSGTTGSGGGTGSGGAGGGVSERPSEEVLREVFGAFGAIRHVDIPMLDPYREETSGRGFHTFSFGGHLNFEAYVQYREYAGFLRAMGALRGMKLMFKGDDGKAVACNIKVSFDNTKHLSEASIRRRQLERQKLRELELQREEQKRREKEEEERQRAAEREEQKRREKEEEERQRAEERWAGPPEGWAGSPELQREEQKRREKEEEERQRAEERRQREQEEQQRARRREEKLRRREQREREREARRGRRRVEKLQAEEQRRLRVRVRTEERRLLLAQRNLQSLRLVAELLSRAEAAERRRQQEAELRRVEQEKARALGLQRRERELRQRLLSLLLGRRPPGPGHAPSAGHAPSDPAHPPDHAPSADHAPHSAARDLLLDMLRGVTRAEAPPPAPPATPPGPQTPPPGPPATPPAPATPLRGQEEAEEDGERRRREKHGRRRRGDRGGRSRSRSPRRR